MPNCIGLIHSFVFVKVFSFMFVLLAGCSMKSEPTTLVVDSEMTFEEAIQGVNPECPQDILSQQTLVEVKYFGFDGKIHKGQLVIDRELERDVVEVFEEALKNRFPIGSVIPVSDSRFRKDGVWSDDLSMEANNTSAFNYRPITNGKKLSNHALGRAIDINPRNNPYKKGEVVLPPGAEYDIKTPGTLTEESVIVKKFLDLGWEWGGNWTSLKDYQHFEKATK